MPATAAANSISLAQENLRLSLAACAAVQTWMGVLTAELAAAKIYHHGLPEPDDGHVYTREELEDLRPYIVVFTAERQGFQLDLAAMDDGFQFAAQGKLRARLYQNCPNGYDDQPTSDANMQFTNTLGAILDGLAGLAGSGGYFAPHLIRLEDGPFWPHPKAVPDEGLWQGAELYFEWRGL